MIKKKYLAIIIGLVIVIIPTSVYGYNSYNYNRLYSAGLTALDNDNFDEAVTDFNNASEYAKNNNSEITDIISKANRLKISKENFEEGMKFYSEKKYPEALDKFKLVISEDKNRYATTQAKIAESKESYISLNLDLAKEEAKNKKYEQAIVYLEKITKFDAGNATATSLINEYKIEAKKAQENAAKQRNAGYPKVIYNNSGFMIFENEQQTAGVGIGVSWLGFTAQPNGISFVLFKAGTDEPVTYKAVFHLEGIDVVKTGVASNDWQFQGLGGPWLNNGSTYKVDFEVTYKGRSYRFSKSFYVQ